MNMEIRRLSALCLAASLLACSSVSRSQRPGVAARAELIHFGILGDAGKWEEGSRLTRDSMLALDTRRLVLPGDNIYSPTRTYDEAWSPWSEKGFSFDFVAIGNHNIGYDKEIAYFKMPSEYYSRAVGDSLRFIVLNSDDTGNVGEQMKWLNSELASAKEPLLFVVYHHPSYTVAPAGHDWQDKKDFQLGIRPLLKKYRAKITALLVGHDHLASLIHFDDLPVVLSGAGREVRDDTAINNVQDGVRVSTAYYFESSFTWVRMTVDPSKKGEALVEYVRSKDNRVMCTARVATGKRAELQTDCGKSGGR